MKKYIGAAIIFAFIVGGQFISQMGDVEYEEGMSAYDAAVADLGNEPSLPDMDFSDMSFEEDGYEVVTIASISDGDTAHFIMDDEDVKCRFLAINTPEISGESGPEPYAKEASEYTKAMLMNAHEIILEKDSASDSYDRYGRLLTWVWVDGELLNYGLVEKGLAQVAYLYDDYTYNEDLIELEALAKLYQVGIWE